MLIDLNCVTAKCHHVPQCLSVDGSQDGIVFISHIQQTADELDDVMIDV